jgi:hypothetical protein
VLALLVAVPAAAVLAGDDEKGRGDGTASPAVGDTASSDTSETSPTSDTRAEPPTSGTSVPEAPVAMIDVRGMSLEEAEDALRDADIEFEVEEEVGGGQIGTVLEQRPAPGEDVVGPAQLTVAVAPATMPDLVELTLDDAQARMEDVGATVTVVEVLDEGRPDGTVVAQTPAAGEPFAPQVELQVARQPVSVFLADLDAVEGGFAEVQANVNGVDYVHSLVEHADSGPDLAGYDLGRHYTRFRAIVGQRDDSDSGVVVRFEVFADGRPVYQRDLALGEQDTVDLDVTGVLRLQLVVTKLGEHDLRDAYGVFADARVLGLPSEVPTTTGD